MTAVFITVYNGTEQEIADVPISHGNLLFDETNNIIYYDNENNERHIYGRSIASETIDNRLSAVEKICSTLSPIVATNTNNISAINNKLGNTSYASKGSTITEALSRVPRVYYGTTAPSASTGVNGDIYLRLVE